MIENAPVVHAQYGKADSSVPRVKRKAARQQTDVADDAEPTTRSRRESHETKPSRYLLTGADGPVELLREEVTSNDELPFESACDLECPTFWEHRNDVWGEFLYLRPRGADVAYATPVDGTLSTSVPVGPQAVAAFGYNAGVRIGGAWALDRSSSFTANYTWYQASASDSVSLAGGGSFLRGDTVHPSTVNVAADSFDAQSAYDFKMQMIDANYKSLFWNGDDFAVNYVLGLRYAQIQQQFDATYSILGTTSVDTNVNFNGVGPRFGLEGERLIGERGLMVYSKGAVNFLFGSNSADYMQTNVFSGVQAQTALRETRVVTVPEFELGVGWQSANGSFRITGGYYLAAWFNMMTTPEYLSTVREVPNSFERQATTMTLDGLNLRAEWRF